MSGRLEVRSVNGDGPACGCGKRSTLHVAEQGNLKRDYFLCLECSVAAVERYMRATRQDHSGPPPGDYCNGLYQREHDKGHHRHRQLVWCPGCIADREAAVCVHDWVLAPPGDDHCRKCGAYR